LIFHKKCCILHLAGFGCTENIRTGCADDLFTIWGSFKNNQNREVSTLFASSWILTQTAYNMLFTSQRSAQATDDATAPPADIKACASAAEKIEKEWTVAVEKVNIIFMEALL
jgi:hypothetical protein